MFWNVTFIYNAIIRTTDHCKVQTRDGPNVRLAHNILTAEGLGGLTERVPNVRPNVVR